MPIYLKEQVKLLVQYWGLLRLPLSDVKIQVYCGETLQGLNAVFVKRYYDMLVPFRRYLNFE